MVIDEIFRLEATIAPQPNGSYLVVALKMDGRYFEATERQQPGLFHVSKDRYGWKTDYSKIGRPKPEKNRAVAIADSCYSDPERAATKAASFLSRVGGPITKTTLEGDGFDIHFTPGQRRLGGLIRYNAIAIEAVHGPAALLADMMYTARKFERVNWVAEHGGSAILTQAMKILAARGVTLKGHNIYLYRPKTSPGDTTRLAHQLELTLEDDFAKTGFDPVGGFSKSRAAPARLSDQNDPYNLSAHFKASMIGLGKMGTAVGLGAAAGSSVGVAYPALAAISGVVAKVTAITTVALGAGAVAQHAIEPYAHKFPTGRVTKG